MPMKDCHYNIVDPDFGVWSIFPRNLWVEIVKTWSLQQENIKTPIEPTRKALPFSQQEMSAMYFQRNGTEILYLL